MVKVYLHKYALSSGKIREIEGEFNKKFPDIFNPIGEYKYTFFTKKDVSLTMEEAIKESKKRQKRKIESLEKQIEKLRRLDFDWTSIKS